MTAVDRPISVKTSPSGKGLRSLVGRVLAIVVLLLVVAWGAVYLVAYRAGVEGRAAHFQQEWPAARAGLQHYLRYFPGDTGGRLMLAEAIIKDDGTAPRKDVAAAALEQLGRIPDSAPEGSVARAQEGRIAWLLLVRPAQAERSLRRAVALDPQFLEAWQLLWSRLVATGSGDDAEPAFWKVYELTPVEQRTECLRDWYLSQFFPISTNRDLDERLGFFDKDNAALSLFRRLTAFRDSEPEAAAHHAAVAEWLQNEGDHATALEVLRRAEKFVARPLEDRRYVAALVSTLFELGEFEEMHRVYDQWPEPRSGYQFWKWSAIVLEESRNDPAGALEAYHKCLTVWPGHCDWRAQNRKANLLSKLGRGEASAAARQRAQEMETLMSDTYHKRLRERLRNPRDPAVVAEVSEFYRRMGRPQEADAWTQTLSPGASQK